MSIKEFLINFEISRLYESSILSLNPLSLRYTPVDFLSSLKSLIKLFKVSMFLSKLFESNEHLAATKDKWLVEKVPIVSKILRNFFSKIIKRRSSL